MCHATRDIMDCMFEAYLESSLEPDDIPLQSIHPVWVLGKKYDSSQEINLIRQDIRSKLWLTYRKNFIPIGGDSGMTSDKGWGCMLRCGQMVLAQALVNVHLGRDWLWEPDTKDLTYLKILRKFEDQRKAPFSIHQIAMMGASEGKDVGQWFSPNVVAQVLKKLIKYDEWCSLTIHVALHNTVVINEISIMPGPDMQYSTNAEPNIHESRLLWMSAGNRQAKMLDIHFARFNVGKVVQIKADKHECLYDHNSHPHIREAVRHLIKKECTVKDENSSTKHIRSSWKPLLLIVPLRLGLTDLNPIYVNGLKKCFQFRQTLGVIGGKPNLALYFIGHVGDEVIYLDPHTTHRTGFVDTKETEEQIQADYTYHKQYASRMNILSMDPSVAICFYCGTEAEFNELCQLFKDELIDPESQPLFEICCDSPKQWSPPKTNTAPGAASLLSAEERHFDSDEFEII